MIKKYAFEFDFWALVLFFAVMLPSFIWFAFPAPDDVLREKSQTPVLDMAGSIFQVAFVAALCFVKRNDAEKAKRSKLIILTAVSALLYYVGWICYYAGLTNPAVILALTVFPCAAFIFYAVDRKNYLALTLAIIFACCHITGAVINHII
ncbi:MAG: hypothetical protein IJL87_06355 [Clostridia bacterium]|nr:hypothetical protein [Clostridia bacterium]